MKTYKVEVVEIKSREIVDTIGTGLSENQANKTLMGVLINLNREDYFVRIVEEV